MKIMFLCGCLEQGKDGVGDYVHRLALLCSHKNVECYKVAINDSFISEIIWNTKENILRLPANLRYEDKIKKLIDLTEFFQPDWISLQFVSFSFDHMQL